MLLGAVRGHFGGKVGAVLCDEVDSFIHVCPLHPFLARLPGHLHLVGLVPGRMVFNTPDIGESSAARHSGLTRVSGQRPEQGADAKFFAQKKNVGTRPLPCTVSFCLSYAAGELIRLSTHLSLHFGSTVDSRVVIGFLKLVRLSERLSHWLCRLSYRLSYRLSRHDLQDVRWRFAAFNPAEVAAAEVSAK